MTDCCAESQLPPITVTLSHAWLTLFLGTCRAQAKKGGKSLRTVVDAEAVFGFDCEVGNDP